MKRIEWRFAAQDIQFDALVGDDVTVAVEVEGTDICLNLAATVSNVDDGKVTLQLEDSATGQIYAEATKLLAKGGVHLN